MADANAPGRGAHRAPYHVLFLCTGNSARSVLAESLLRGLGGARFVAHSAGSRPVGVVNPFAIELLRARGLPVDGLRSKSWDEFARPGAPELDFVITVCGNAAGEACPVWPGRPANAHWGVSDPAGVAGDDARKRRAFADAYERLAASIRGLVALDDATLSAPAAGARLRELAPAAERSDER